MNLIQMENLEGGLDCSKGGQLTRVAGAAVGGAVFFGFGAVLTTLGMTLYNGFACNNAGAEASHW